MAFLLLPCSQVSNSIYTLSLELYTPTAANLARYTFEVLLAAGIVLLAALQLLDIARAVLTAKGRRKGGLRGYLSRGSTWLSLVNNALLLAGVGLWWTFVNSHAKTFSMDLRYPVSGQAGLMKLAEHSAGRGRFASTVCPPDTVKVANPWQGTAPCCVPLQVYANLQPKAHFLQLLEDGAGLKAVWEAFRAMEAAIDVLNWYYALNGISILLLIARCVLAGVGVQRLWSVLCCSV